VLITTRLGPSRPYWRGVGLKTSTLLNGESQISVGAQLASYVSPRPSLLEKRGLGRLVLDVVRQVDAAPYVSEAILDIHGTLRSTRMFPP